MTSTVLLHLAGVLQSWGTRSHYSNRETDTHPSKSGVIGIVAAALGIQRDDTARLAELSALRFAVRVDQPGQLTRDFHTSQPAGRPDTSISYRFYLADAVFVAALEGPDDLIEYIAEALDNPVYAPSLGRKSCPPNGRVSLGIRHTNAVDALNDEPWHGRPWWVRKNRYSATMNLPVIRDGEAGERGDVVLDTPVSFSTDGRVHAPRTVVYGIPVTVTNPQYIPAPPDRGDPFLTLLTES